MRAQQLLLGIAVLTSSPTVGLAQARIAPVGGARGEVTLLHRNEAAAGVVLESATYELKGRPFSVALKGSELKDGQDVKVLGGAFIAGPTTLKVSLVYRGSSMFLFPYASDFKYRVTAEYPLRIQEGKPVVLRAVGFEAGSVTEPPHRRLKVRIEEAERLAVAAQ